VLHPPTESAADSVEKLHFRISSTLTSKFFARDSSV
jgi:hypothetical protein